MQHVWCYQNINSTNNLPRWQHHIPKNKHSKLKAKLTHWNNRKWKHHKWNCCLLSPNHAFSMNATSTCFIKAYISQPLADVYVDSGWQRPQPGSAALNCVTHFSTTVNCIPWRCRRSSRLVSANAAPGVNTPPLWHTTIIYSHSKTR